MFLRYRDVSDVLRCVSKVLVDGGYSGDPFSSAVKRIVGAEVEVAKRSERHTLWLFRSVGLSSVVLVG